MWLLMPLGFVLMLLIVGCATYIIALNNSSVGFVPYIAYMCLCAGMGALFVSLSLAMLIVGIEKSFFSFGLGFLPGYVIGAVGGMLIGLWRARRRIRRLKRAHSL
jgi:hypothetical protein